MERAAIFIDGAYFDKLLEHEFDLARVAYDSLAKHISGESQILRTYYYHCAPYQSNPPTPEERQRTSSFNRFSAALSRLQRFQVRLGKLACRGTDKDGKRIFVQKRVDILIGVDMVQLAATRQIQRAILLAGDSDLVPAVEAVKQHGVLVILWHGPKRSGLDNTVHHELWEACDERFLIDQDMIDKILRP